MITTEDINKIRQQVTAKQINKGKITTDTIEGIRQQLAQRQAAQQPPIEQPVVQQPVQPTISQPNFANHASMSQQGHNNIAQKQATIDNNITKPMTNYLQSGGKIDINDTASLAQLAREQGVQDTNYLQGRQQALNQPTLQQQYKVLPGSTTSVAISQNNIAPVEAYDTNYGKNEAKSVTDNLKVTNENQNADVYLKAKSDLAEAQANNDKRGIAKNEAIIEDYKKKYLASYDGTKKDYSITSIRKHLQQQGEDINKAEQKWQNATTDEEKQRAAEEYQDAVNIYNRTLKNYQEAVVYDETINNNLLKDTAKSFDTGFLGGVAKIEGGSYALASKLGGLDATTINADSLLDYNNGKNFSLQDVTNGVNLLNPTTNMMTKATGISEGPLSAYLHLKELAALSPNNKRLANLYNEITNRTYKGTKEELANELDQIQKELYQDFKDRYTQGTLNKEREQLEHNENVYGKYAMLPNAVNTVANMLPSQMLTPIGGEALSLGAMGVGAGQQAMDEALESGARYNQAFNYGVASGATEVATEKMFESGLNKALGIKGTIDPQKLAGKLIDKLGIENKIAKAVINTTGSVAGEMTEEMVSEAVNPLWKFLTYDKNGLPKNGYEYAKSIFEAGIEAIPSTLLMEGMGGGIRVAKVSQIEQGIIQSINTSDLSPIVKNQLISEVRKASTDVKLGLEENEYMQDKAYEKYANLSAQSEQMKQRIPEGYSLPQSTIDILAYTENNRPGLTIAFDSTIKGNGNFVDNGDGTRTITLNPNSKRAVEFTLTHELGHDLKETAEYEQLQNLLIDYAKGKPNYQKSLNALDKTYKESGANYNLQDEATNDMLGQAIGEQEFYNKLAENPTLFNRVTSGLKNLLGNKDTKLKNKIEKLTSNALKQEYKGNDNQVRNSLGENENEVLTFKAANGDNVEIIKNPTDVMLDRFENDAKKKYASEYIGERPDNNILRRTFDNKGNVYYWAAADMAHEPIENFLKEKNPGYNFSQHPEQIIENYNPSENYYYRETRYSLSEAPTQDNQGRQLSEGQQEFYRDASYKVKDNNGKLLNLYHTTPNKFTIFDKSKMGDNTAYSNTPFGFFVTPNKAFSTRFGDINEKGLNSNIMSLYTNAKNIITHPFNASDKYQGEELDNIVRKYNEAVYPEVGMEYLEETLAEMRETDPDTTLYDAYMASVFDSDVFENAEEERKILEEKGYDGVEFVEGLERDLVKDSNSDEPVISFAIFNPNQLKNVDNLNPTDNEDIRYQKQNASWQQFLDDTYGKWNTGTRTNFTKTDTTMLPSNEELQQQEKKNIEKEPIVQANKITPTKRLDDVRDFKKVGDRKVNAYQYDNPEVKPFFQQEAKNMLYDLNNAIKGERTATWDDYGELHYTGVTRETVQDIADLLDGKNGVKLSYDDIRKGLEAIIKDEGSENIAAAKRIEMVLDKRLREGYTDSYGTEYEPNDNYLNFLAGKDFIDPAEYDKQVQDKLIADYEAENDDGTLFSLSEKEQKEVNDYADKLFEDKTLDENFATDVYDRLKRVQNYADFENIKQEVSDYKDKMYKGISGLEDIANLKPEDVKQREMTYKQRKDKNTTNQRKFFENAETSPIIAEQTKNNVNATTYEQKANLDTLEEVRQKLDERGNDLVEEWKSKQKNFTGKDVALGAILIERYQQEGDWQSAARTVEKLADMGTEAGRAVQMYSIFQRLSPETMAIYQQKALDKAFEEMKQRKTGKWVEANKDKYKLTAEDTQFIYEQVEKASQAVDEETKQRELSKIENRINEKLPPEDGQTIKALRRIAMLFNPKTQVRNIVGNAVITPVNDVADFIGSKIDKLISKKTGVRTTNNPNLITKAKGFKKGIKDAITDYRTGTRTTPTGSKYEFDFGARAFNENTNNKTLNAINRKLNGINDLLSAVMSGGDRPFYEAAYQNSLEGQMKANKVTEPTQDMIDIAVNEALQRTWNDDNEYTKAVLGIRRAMNHINIHGFGLGDLIIPFAKTPANLTKAMVEYSPVGFLEAAYDFNDMRKAISRGEMTPMQQKRFVNATSKAITGSMLYLIAGMLVKSGSITGSADDDKDVKNFEQNVLGIQPYSVKVGDKTYTYSWMNPINAPLAIAADTYKMSKENASKWDIIKNAFKVAGETLVDNSFLSGIKELFSKDSISEGLIDAIESFPESLMPTFMSQIASLGDKTQRQTFEYQNDFKTISNKIKNKVPGARNTLEPQVNTFGEEIENQNTILNAFINPANVREARITDEQKALYDVYLETKDKTIFPMQAPYYTNTDNGEKKNLSSKDRVDYQKASGKYVNDIYKDLFKNDRFIGSSNEEKVKILHEIAKDGNTKGREKVGAIKEITNSNLSKLNENIESLEDAGIPLADFYIAWYAKSNHALGKTHAAQKKAIRDYTDLTSEQENVLYEIFNIK